MNKIKNGFTLLELLVVIGIIGILVALATVSYSATQKGARDSKRKQDLIAIQNALEQYYSATSYKYPNSGSSCSPAVSYMSNAWPKDPDGTAYSESCPDGIVYCVCAEMDSLNSGNASNASCTFSNATKTHYCVTNLQ